MNKNKFTIESQIEGNQHQGKLLTLMNINDTARQNSVLILVHLEIVAFILDISNQHKSKLASQI